MVSVIDWFGSIWLMFAATDTIGASPPLWQPSHPSAAIPPKRASERRPKLMTATNASRALRVVFACRGHEALGFARADRAALGRRGIPMGIERHDLSRRRTTASARLSRS